MRAGTALLGGTGWRLGGGWARRSPTTRCDVSAQQVERTWNLAYPSAMTTDDWRIVIQPDEVKGVAGKSAAEMARAKFDEAPVRSVLGRVLRVHTEERAWRKGAAGERSVGKLLAKLPKDRWKVFDDVPLGSDGVNVDHLLIGSAGVYTINTKNLSGKVWLASRALRVNGQKNDYLRAAASEGRKVGQRLSAAVGEQVDVTPMILLICEELTIKERPADVQVFKHRDGIAWLKRRPDAIPLAQASRIARVVGRAGTWT